jgi:glycosyltransferase involved in cell wall biosynthesis/SAM-dependent methyltransferase
MRVLQINKFLWPSGGPERYMLEAADMLRLDGHDVRFFAMEHPRNLPSDLSRYFVSRIDYRDKSAWYKLKTALKTMGKTIYSLESKRKLQSLLSVYKPDVAHIHMISRQISPSILPVLKRAGVPIVQTVHNMELLCPNAHCFIDHRRESCDRCLNGRYYQAIMRRCVRHSLAASTLSAVAQYAHRGLGIYEKHVDLFICPSKFLARRLSAGGIPEEKIRHLPNCIDLRGYALNYEVGRYGIFMGRLSPEKGVRTLLEAAEQTRDIPLVIVGEGRQERELRQLAAERNINHVAFVGFKDGGELKQLVCQAAFVVLPSECYENSPMVIFEAGASGKPVIASDLGGTCELIRHGETGLLFSPGDSTQLAEQMRLLHRDKAQCKEMGRRNRRNIEQTCEGHCERLMALYAEARNGISFAKSSANIVKAGRNGCTDPNQLPHYTHTNACPHPSPFPRGEGTTIINYTTSEPRRIRALRKIYGETRPMERIRQHYELEKRLAAKLMAANDLDRRALYTEVYDQYMRAVDDGFYHRVRNDGRHQAKQRSIALKLLGRFLRPETVYMELGPGDCNVALAVAQRVKQVYAVDVSKEITNGFSIPKNFELIISDGTSVHVPPESVDVAYSNQLMEHVHPDDAFQQLLGIRRALRPGGVYICRTPNALSGPHDVSAFFDDAATGFHLKEYTYGELAAVFRRAGFRKIRAIVGARGHNLPLACPVGPLSLLEKTLQRLPRRLRKAVAYTLPMRFVLNIQLIARK